MFSRGPHKVPVPIRFGCSRHRQPPRVMAGCFLTASILARIAPHLIARRGGGHGVLACRVSRHFAKMRAVKVKASKLPPLPSRSPSLPKNPLRLASLFLPTVRPRPRLGSHTHAKLSPTLNACQTHQQYLQGARDGVAKLTLFKSIHVVSFWQTFQFWCSALRTLQISLAHRGTQERRKGRTNERGEEVR